MIHTSLTGALLAVPAGAWAVGVSGGADSVAILRLLRTRPDLDLVVAHLNHQTRGKQSDDDEKFVRSLCSELEINSVFARREEIERANSFAKYPSNPSAKYRRLRFDFFREVAARENLDGVILAHHADDQAETVLQRLLRGSGFGALAGMFPHARINGMSVIRPLLDVRRATLRRWLADNRFTWREDSSNESQMYQRNRLRRFLLDREDITTALLDLARACANLRSWAKLHSPTLENEFALGTLADLPALLARYSAGAWLRARGSPAELVVRAAVDRLIAMCADAATSPRQEFPGGIAVSRKKSKISAQGLSV